MAILKPFIFSITLRERALEARVLEKLEVILFYFIQQFFLCEKVFITIVSYALFLSQSLGRMLDARQLGLKLIANVTFGYTSAHYSGRMPCVEVRQVKLVHGNSYISAACVKQKVRAREREIGGEFSC